MGKKTNLKKALKRPQSGFVRPDPHKDRYRALGKPLHETGAAFERPITAVVHRKPLGRVSNKDHGEVIRKRSRSRSQKKHEDMYTKSDVWDREREERDAKLREETKKELKELLTKYIGSERAKYAVNKAQHQMGVMIERKSKAAKQMKDINDECKCFPYFLVFGKF